MLVRPIRSLSAAALPYTVVGLMLAASVAVAAENEAARVEAVRPRGVQIAIVDARKASVARDAQHRLLVSNLSAAASVRKGEAVAIGAECVSASEAKARFLAGDCAAVLLLADDRPFTLRRLEVTTYCGMLEPDWGVHPVYLMVPREPDAVQVLVSGAFTQLLGDRAALRAILAAGNGGTVAAVTPLTQ